MFFFEGGGALLSSHLFPRPHNSRDYPLDPLSAPLERERAAQATFGTSELATEQTGKGPLDLI